MNKHRLVLLSDIVKTSELPDQVVRALMETTDIGIAVVQDMRVKFTNQQFLDKIGYTRDELEKKFIVELVHPDDVDYLLKRYVGVREGTDNGSTPIEFRVITKDGVIVHVEAKVSLIQWEGDVAGLCLFWDIAKRKEVEDLLRDEVKRRSEILDGISERLIHTDTSLKIVWANRAAAEPLGLSSDDLTGRFCYEIFGQSERPCDGCPAVETIVTGRTAEGRVPYPGRRTWAIRAFPVMGDSGIPTGLIIKGVDVTDFGPDRPWADAGQPASPRSVLSAPADPNYLYPFSLSIGRPDGRLMVVLGWEERLQEIMLEKISRSEVHSARLLYLAARMKSDGQGWVDKEDIRPGKMDYNLYDLRKSLEQCHIPWLDGRSARMLIRSRGESSRMIRLAVKPDNITIYPEIAGFRSKKVGLLAGTDKRIASLQKDVSRWPDDEYLSHELVIQRKNRENLRKSIQTVEFLVTESTRLLGLPY